MYSKTIKNAFVAMFALTFLSVPTFAQIFNTLGIGIASPQGTLHVHTSQGYNYDGPIRDGLYPYDYYRTLFRITNTITGTSSADGFVVDQIDNEVTLRQGGRMQKVEELTLYVIELQKQINDLKNTIQ